MKAIICVLLLGFFSQVYSEDLYTIKSSVTPLNNINFQKQINNQRIRDVSIVFIYKEVGILFLSNPKMHE